MPNWCSNYLSISGPYADVKRFTEEVKDKDSSGNDMVLSFNKHVPVWDGDNMIEGMDPCEDWGTKWNSDCSDMHNEGVFKLDSGDGEIQYSFQSAWGPPCEWLEAVVPMFPTLEFEMQYEEVTSMESPRVLRVCSLITLCPSKNGWKRLTNITPLPKTLLRKCPRTTLSNTSPR